MSQTSPLFALALAGLGACAAAPEPAHAPSAAAPPAESAPPPAASSAAVAVAVPAPVPAPAPALPAIPKGTAVLHIGDSFAVAGFAQALKSHMQALGVRYEVRAETSSFTTTWAAKMDLLVSNTQPDLVIINLGANEFANTDPPAHAPAIRRIVKAVGDRPCVWVSPPRGARTPGSPT